jgi:hypothetical protein
MPGKQPNIIFVLCDNIGWGDFSCYGGNTPTPRIDQLTNEGIRFNNHWGAPRLPDSPSIRMDIWKGKVITSTKEELLTGIQRLSTDARGRIAAGSTPQRHPVHMY